MNFSENKRSRDANLRDVVLSVRHVSKTTKGGRNLSFSAIVVVGNGRGLVGFGKGAAAEVSAAVKKAREEGKRNMRRVVLKDGGRTFHHDVCGKFAGSIVLLRASGPGTGVRGCGAIRSILQCLGVRDAVCKIHGSTNVLSVIRAVSDAFDCCTSPRMISYKRSMALNELR